MENHSGPSGSQIIPWNNRLGAWPSTLFDLNAGRITLIYLFLGLSALVFSDFLIVGPLANPVLAQVQALKGAIEVFLTGGIIFVLIRTYESQVQQSQTKIEKQRDELHLLHRVVRHNLRNDLSVLYGLMDSSIDEESPGGIPDTRKKVSERLKKMEKNIDHLQKIRDVTRGNLDTVTVNLSDAIDSTLKTHPHITEDIDVSVSVPEDVAVECNPMLREAIKELLTNAIRHNTSPHPKIEIDVDPDSGPTGTVAVHITDNGPGLPPMEIKSLQARKGKEMSQVVHSTGLGLWFVDWVITHSDGELLVDVSEPEGTRITLCLPAG